MALEKPTPLPFPEADMNLPVFASEGQENIVEFAERFGSLQGKFVFCSSVEELELKFKQLCELNQWTKIFCEEEPWRVLIDQDFLETNISECQVAVTGCEYLVARTGSMVLSSRLQGRVPSVYAPIHICIARSSQVVPDISDALTALQVKYQGVIPSQISFATGPSRTADIEKTLVVGVHGPGEVYCFIVDE